MMPTACCMEDLSGQCRALFAKLLLIDGFVGSHWLSPKALACRKAMVWLVDKAIREYNQARMSLVLELAQEKLLDELAQENRYEELENSDQRLGYMLDFTDHMENCVLTCGRMLRFLKVLKSDRTIARMDHVTVNLIESAKKALTDVRNTLEHMEEKIALSNIPDGQTLTVVLADDRSIRVGSHSLRFDQLASTLKGLHSIAEGLFNKPS